MISPFVTQLLAEIANNEANAHHECRYAIKYLDNLPPSPEVDQKKQLIHTAAAAHAQVAQFFLKLVGDRLLKEQNQP